MSKIKVMSPALSNRIAAGEVIERPASVVKELVENAIDAGATQIGVEIERAGSRLIAVTDNGCGMDSEDAMLALEQHGTSKLLCEDDLNTIMTLGFRGEALPSIASISCFKLTTRTADAAEGVMVTTDGSAPPEIQPCACAVGTRIEVRELFHNLPARKKFLKSPATEEHHIEEALSALAIGHPEIGFRLTLDGRNVLNSPGSGNLEYRLQELFGKGFSGKMLTVEHQENRMHISGFIGAPGFTRPSRRDQRVFINSRAVEAQAIYRGIKDGYATLAEPGRYNPVVLFVEMPPDELDVNVHPAKREVRFRSEYAVSRAVAAAVSGALRKMREPGTAVGSGAGDAGGLPAAGTVSLPFSGKVPLTLVLDAAEVRYDVPEKVQQSLISEVSAPAVETLPVLNAEAVEPGEAVEAAEAVEPGEAVEAAEAFDANEISPSAVDAVESTASLQQECRTLLAKQGSWGRNPAFTGEWPERILGVIDHTYIIAESSGGMVMIDQHAAHERVMFERLLHIAAAGECVSQVLLLPETVELPRSMMPVLLDNQAVFTALGFEVEAVGSTTVMVSSLPASFGSCGNVERIFMDMLAELLENFGSRLPVALENVARAACKAAVKAHDVLSENELQILLRELRECRQGTLCPHGRPTMVSMSIKELEKRFFRR